MFYFNARVGDGVLKGADGVHLSDTAAARAYATAPIIDRSRESPPQSRESRFMRCSLRVLQQNRGQSGRSSKRPKSRQIRSSNAGCCPRARRADVVMWLLVS